MWEGLKRAAKHAIGFVKEHKLLSTGLYGVSKIVPAGWSDVTNTAAKYADEAGYGRVRRFRRKKVGRG